MPVIILTCVGAKSGKLRKAALMRVEHEGNYAIVGSFAGGAKHPTWYHNVKANPHVELQDGPTPRDMVAREASDDEKELWWGRAVAAFEKYETYKDMTSRDIPLFILEPMDDTTP